MDLSVDDKSRKKEGYIEITANVYLDVAVLDLPLSQFVKM
jgi:hypothetical protein